MGFDLIGLRAAIAAHGTVARVVIAAIKGSSPREVGAAMLVWPGGQSGTIGGGALEYQLAQTALEHTTDTLSQHALGPDLGQCCGGSVQILTEIYDATRAAALPDDVIARGPGAMPLPVRRLLANARAQGSEPQPTLIKGWLIEPVHKPTRNIWIWGAGHVGRAIVTVLAPLPDLNITWVDTSPDRFPNHIPTGVTTVPAADPTILMQHAPKDAEHLILTYSHALDLALCDAALRHGFARAGVIGSATKWARFRSRLDAAGHSAAQIARITCPIGDPTLGKHPQAIAIGIGADMMAQTQSTRTKEKSA